MAVTTAAQGITSQTFPGNPRKFGSITKLSEKFNTSRQYCVIVNTELTFKLIPFCTYDYGIGRYIPLSLDRYDCRYYKVCLLWTSVHSACVSLVLSG